MTTRNANGGDQITDADALLPNGCELTNYLEGGPTNKRTKCAVIIRNGSQSTASSNPITVEPLLPTDKNVQSIGQEKYDLKLYLQDPISYAVGQFGRWQLQLTMLLALFNFPCTWHIFVLTFQGDQGSDYWCSRPEHLKDMPVSEWRNFSGILEMKNKYQYNPCVIRDLDYNNLDFMANHKEVEATKKCNSWEFSKRGDSIVSEWALVCDKAQLSNMAEMMFLLGVALGGFFSGLVSDRFGRKKTLMMSLLLQIIVGVLVAICPWFEVFLILRAVLGFVCVSIVFSGLILCMELVGGKWLTIAGVSYMFPVPLSYIILAGMAYTARGWRHLQLSITLPSIFFLSFWWILPESPRWLLTTGQIDKVMDILREAARVNKRTLPPNIDKVLKQSISVVDVTDKPKGRISDLFRTPTIRLISIVLYVIWFSVYLVYYGLVLNLSNIGGDVYINTIISGIVEVPAIGLSILILLKMGRRIPLCLTLVCAGTACFLTLIVPESIQEGGVIVDEHPSEWVTISLVMVGKFTVSASNVIMPVFTAELFPTVIRNLGVGSSNVPAGIALMIVPYLWNLAKIHRHLPMMILGITGVVGGLSVLLLPETSNQGLAATLEDIEEETSVKKQKEIESTK